MVIRLERKKEMLKRYAIWNKHDDVITPSGAVFTAEQWKAKYPVARLDKIVVVCSQGEINGGFFGTLGQMVQMYQDVIDFSKAKTNEQKLELIEQYEDEMNKPPVDNGESTAQERIASALETQVLLAMSTVNTDDPDL